MKLEILKKILPYWDLLEPEEQKKLIMNSAIHECVKGDVLKGEGTECFGGMYVIKGRIRAYIIGDDGRQITLFYLNNNDICMLTANCIMPSIAFEIQVECEEPTAVLQIKTNELDVLAKKYPQVENFALKLVVERFSDVVWKIEQSHSYSLEQRLAMHLYDEIIRTGRLIINTTHEQIANSLSSAREVISRSIKNFEKEGLLKLGRGTVEILNKAELMKKMR